MRVFGILAACVLGRVFFFSSRRRHTRLQGDWSSDVCSSDLLGWTQHTTGAQILRTGAMVQLLLGNIGVAGGGMNALRGHSNIQGLTDLGILSASLPGYLTLPNEGEQDYQKYIDARTPKAMRPGQMNYWSNTPKFHVSLMKADRKSVV